MNQIVKGKDSPVTALQKLLVANQHQIELALPKHLRPERLIRLAVTALKTTPSLQNCSLLSICNSVMLSAQLGLEINNGLGHGWLIPYGKICTYQPGYRGLLDLSYRTGSIRDARAIVVYEHEPFAYEEGARPVFSHTPMAASDRRMGSQKWIGAYNRLTSIDNYQSCFWMWKEEIEEIRDKCSRVKDKDGKIVGPWVTWFWEMTKKTVIKRHLKMQHLSSDVALAVGVDDQAEAYSATDDKLTRLQVAQDLVLENGIIDQAIQADDELEGSLDQQQQVAQEKLTEAGQSDQWWASVKESVNKLINSKKFPASKNLEYQQRLGNCPLGNAILDLKLEVEDLIKSEKQ